MRWPTRHLPVIVLAWSAVAHGHVGPSERENNRYLKLTVQGNRARLLYTFYVGNEPGAQLRRRLDQNRDGRLDAAETEHFGVEVAAQVSTNVQLIVDGQRFQGKWEPPQVGLGTDTVAAGALSVDLVVWLCLESPGTDERHTIELADHWHPPQLGETELRIEPAPGVHISRTSLGPESQGVQLRHRWAGRPGPLDEHGLVLEFMVDRREADISKHPACAPRDRSDASKTDQQPGNFWLLAGLMAGLAMLATVLAGRRRRR